MQHYSLFPTPFCNIFPYHETMSAFKDAEEKLLDFYLCLCSSTRERMDELKHKLLCINFELECTKMQFLEEKARDEETIKQLIELYEIACKERDEAREQLQRLKAQLSPFVQRETNSLQIPITSQNISEPFNPPLLSSTPENMVIDSGNVGFPKHSFVQVDHDSLKIEYLAMGKELPEKGKLMQAVMEAGPLLETLLVAGPVPKWRNPPPLLAIKTLPNSALSPRISGGFSQKQTLCFNGGNGSGSQFAKRSL